MSTQTRAAGPARGTWAPSFAIEAHDLVKTYPKGVRALDGLSFAVPGRHRIRTARPQRGWQVHHG